MHSDPGRSAPVRVVLVDPDDRVRESLCGLLCIGDRIVVVGSAGETETALKVIRETSPDVVVLDPRLPDVDGGRSFIAQVRATAARIGVVVLTGGGPDDQHDLAAVADGFVRKTFRPSDLVAAVVGAVPVAG
ncbi:MAG: response regulator transcription factor [Chloroflexota bacterium]